MALTLVLGPANSAKAGVVFDGYRLAARRDALLVVPTAVDAEYFERELCAEGLILGKALTFAGLLDEIAARVGFEANVIDGRLRERLLRQVIGDAKLDRLSGVAESPGFVRAGARLIGALEQARVGAPRLTRALKDWSEGTVDGADRAAGAHGAAGAAGAVEHAGEIATIYRNYRAALERRGLADPELFGWAVLDALRAHPDRWGRTELFIYGFDDFTAIELDAIRTLTDTVGASVLVSLTYEPGREALAARAGVVEELRIHADRVLQLDPLDDYYEPQARAALHHLERQLFAPDAQAEDPRDAVELIEAQGELAEAEAIAQRVAQSLTDGIAASELVVVCRSLTRSGALIEQELCRRGIAVNSARRIGVAHTALGRALLALLRMAIAGSRRVEVDDLLSYLRAPGLVSEIGLVDEVDARLRRSGQKTLEGVAASRILATAPGSIAREAIERLRGGERRLGDADGRLHDADERLHDADEPLTRVAEEALRLLAAGRRGSGATLSGDDELDARAAATVISTLQQSAEIDRTLADALDLLSSCELRFREAGDEQSVLIAEPLTIRARRFRHVLISGLCAGEFPSPGASVNEPFIGEEGRQALAVNSGVVLAAPEDWQARERYLLYSAISRATAQVTLTYRSSDESGEPVLASPFLDDLQQVLGAEWRAWRATVRAGGETTASRAASRNAEEPGATGGRDDPSEATERTLSAAALAHVRHARLLSASALEVYAQCPVKWLIDRQLRLKDLEPDGDPQARGTCMHALLERTLRELGRTLSEANLERAYALLESHLKDRDLDPAPGRPPEVKAARMRAIRADLRRYLRHEATSGSTWRTVAFEQHFGEEARAENASSLGPLQLGESEFRLRGVIDRIDVDSSGQRALIRDYKSGTVDSNRQQAKWVENDDLQVALYMLAVKRLLGVTPVAGVYQPLTGGDLRARGVTVSQAEVPIALYGGHELPEPELGDLLETIESRAIELAESLASGAIKPCPQRCSGGKPGCSYPEICWAPR